MEDPKCLPGGDLLPPEKAMQAFDDLRNQLIDRGEATDIFASARDDGLTGMFGNLDQTVFCEPAYPMIESKAAHLLYFVVRNHPFSAGNQRSGAFLFEDSLHRNRRLLDDNKCQRCLAKHKAYTLKGSASLAMGIAARLGVAAPLTPRSSAVTTGASGWQAARLTTGEKRQGRLFLAHSNSAAGAHH